MQKQREAELTNLQEQLSDLTAQLETLDLNIKKYTVAIGQLQEDQQQQQTKNKAEEDAYKVKKKTYELLPNADENIAKLEVCCYVSHDALFLSLLFIIRS